MQDYFSIHDIFEAHKFSKGKGVKVGVIDWLFDENSNVCEHYINLSNNPNGLSARGHGYTMSKTLRKIAPECEIFAISAVDYSVENVSENNLKLLEKAIDYAIKNNIDILTYSQPKVENREKLHNLLLEAKKNNIITTFIHCDDELNLWPYGCFPFKEGNFARKPDFCIYHFDENFIPTNEKLQSFNEKINNKIVVTSGNDIPYFSFSSMSPVLAGLVALIKGYNKTLSIQEIKKLLTETSYHLEKLGTYWFEGGDCDNVLDIGKALTELSKKF